MFNINCLMIIIWCSVFKAFFLLHFSFFLLNSFPVSYNFSLPHCWFDFYHISITISSYPFTPLGISTASVTLLPSSTCIISFFIFSPSLIYYFSSLECSWSLCFDSLFIVTTWGVVISHWCWLHLIWLLHHTKKKIHIIAWKRWRRKRKNKIGNVALGDWL